VAVEILGELSAVFEDGFVPWIGELDEGLGLILLRQHQRDAEDDHGGHQHDEQ
jgi:hypothetical protein